MPDRRKQCGEPAPAQALAGIDLFRNLPPSALGELGQRCHWRRYSPHQAIVDLQADTTEVFFIIQGRVRVAFYSANGREIAFRDLGPGQAFGELAAIDGQPRSAAVIALSECLIAQMSSAAFWQALRENEALATTMLQALARLVRLLSERVIEFSTLAVCGRLHAELLRLARERPSSGNRAVIVPAPTHADIANRISTHREAVTRELNRLARAGLVQKRSGTLIITDLAALERLVHSEANDLHERAAPTLHN